MRFILSSCRSFFGMAQALVYFFGYVLPHVGVPSSREAASARHLLQVLISILQALLKILCCGNFIDRRPV
jgi:hypothetical protein